MRSNLSLTLNIGDVSDILSVTPTTIRNWEKYGLIAPKRHKNGYRYYNIDDVARLKAIKRYLVDERLTVKTVKAMLQAKDIENPDLQAFWRENARSVRGTNTSESLASAKWKKLRLKRGLTLDEVGKSIGISASYLSKLEHGQAHISYDIAERLANYYGENLFFFAPAQKAVPSIVHEGDGQAINGGFLGTASTLLSTLGSESVFPVRFVVQPHCGSLEPHSHAGEEFVYCLSGKISVTLNAVDTYVLKPGDSFHFKASNSHFWRNPTNKVSTMLWVYCSTLNFEEQP